MSQCCLETLRTWQRTRIFEQNEVIRVLNTMLSCCEPIKYSDLNHFSPQKGDLLTVAEKSNDKIGVSGDWDKDDARKRLNNKLGITTLSMVATITDILVGNRLAVVIDDHDVIVSFLWSDEVELK